MLGTQLSSVAPTAVPTPCGCWRIATYAQGHGHGGHGHGNAAKKPKAIPIPDIREVETHYRDYLPLFTATITYLHGKGERQGSGC